MIYNGYYKVMSNSPKMGHLPIPVILRRLYSCLWIFMVNLFFQKFWYRHFGDRFNRVTCPKLGCFTTCFHCHFGIRYAAKFGHPQLFFFPELGAFFFLQRFPVGPNVWGSYPFLWSMRCLWRMWCISWRLACCNLALFVAQTWLLVGGNYSWTASQISHSWLNTNSQLSWLMLSLLTNADKLFGNETRLVTLVQKMLTFVVELLKVPRQADQIGPCHRPPQAACCGRLGFETTLLLCSCGPHDELRLPDCNACLVFDGLSSKYLPSIEQTALPGGKMLQAAASSDPFQLGGLGMGEINIWLTSWCSSCWYTLRSKDRRTCNPPGHLENKAPRSDHKIPKENHWILTLCSMVFFMASGWLPLGSSIGTPGPIFAASSSIFYGRNLPCSVPKTI